MTPAWMVRRSCGIDTAAPWTPGRIIEIPEAQYHIEFISRAAGKGLSGLSDDGTTIGTLDYINVAYTVPINARSSCLRRSCEGCGAPHAETCGCAYCGRACR